MLEARDLSDQLRRRCAPSTTSASSARATASRRSSGRTAPARAPLFNLIAGALPPQSGTVIARRPRHHRRAALRAGGLGRRALVPDHQSVLRPDGVRRTCGSPARCWSRRSRYLAADLERLTHAARARRELLERVRPCRAGRRARSATSRTASSAGSRSRVAHGAASPSCCMLDEPTQGMSPRRHRGDRRR